jgi:hypothetical protein
MPKVKSALRKETKKSSKVATKKPKRLSKKEIEARDKRRAAIHEAGHAIYAHSKGMLLTVEVFPSGTTKPAEEKTWVGRTSFYGQLRKKDKAVMSLVGVVAEYLDEDPDVDWIAVEDYLEDSGVTLSETDRSGIPTDRRKLIAAIETALDFLRQNKSLFDHVVAALLRRGALDMRYLYALVDVLANLEIKTD